MLIWQRLKHFLAQRPQEAKRLAKLLNLQGRWLIVSPVSWVASHNDAMIVAQGESLDLSLDEARLWCQVLADFLAIDNTVLQFYSTHIWLVSADDKPSICAKPAALMESQSLLPILRTLDPTHYWSRFITESQMLFATHPLNATRLTKPPINGVWVFGE